MTTAQSNVTPVVNDSTLATVTLKNLIALDIVEQNEAMLSAFQLLDDSSTRISLPMSRTKEELLETIAKKRQEVDEITKDVSTLKSSIQENATSSDSKTISDLANEFLKDEMPADDVDAMIKKLELENGIKVVQRERNETHRLVDGTKLKEVLAQKNQKALEQTN